MPKETPRPKETTAVIEAVQVEEKPVEKPAAKELPAPQSTNRPIDSISAVKQNRVTTIVKTIITAADSVKIILYDDGEVDGDIVTVFDNGVVVANKLLLTKEPWGMVLPLSAPGAKHTIELVAENEGSIPPNTAYMLVTAGEMRTELKTSSDTKTNGAVVIQKGD